MFKCSVELQKQLEGQCEQELEDAKKVSESGNTPEALQFSKRLTDSVEVCKAIADQKIALATETYKRVRNLCFAFTVMHLIIAFPP